MKREQAQIVIDLMLRQGKELDRMLLQLQAAGLEGDEFGQIRRQVGQLMGSMLLDIMNPTFDSFPDLKPNGLD